MGNRVYLGIGSNTGDRLNNLKRAVTELNNLENTVIMECSSVYFTEPFGVKEQNEFLNAVVSVSTDIELKNLYKSIKRIEEKIGREKFYRWGPRAIDIDVLFYNNLIYSDDEITVPHKGLLERDFVIEPLLEIEPEFFHPGLEMKLAEYDLGKIEKTIIRKEEVDLRN